MAVRSLGFPATVAKVTAPPGPAAAMALSDFVAQMGDGHVWTTASVQGKNGRSATWSGVVMCPASNDAVRMTAGHDEFHGSDPNHLAAHFVPWPSRVVPIPA